MAIDYDAVGLLIGDAAHTLFSTANIYTLSTLYGTATYTLASASARSLAATFANSVTKRAGDVSINASDKYKHYMDLATSLERQAKLYGLGATSVYAGGISKADKLTQEQDSDRVEPYFTRTTHDDPGHDPLTNEDDGY
jgi:hypothetical protein